ncbi:putative membrane protein [Hamadaea flava]|uniref:Phage holin family protein n=1 Tax=Hamadaea flava TaxID=1742688 RepID=A0ABV8LGX0_9ACTN|nr:phage holin family protein [Hamadaea flava]MCP2326308.1 putative membrane protein [Hamadaea flava]
MGILLRLAVNAVALWIATLLISGIYLDTDSVIGQIGTLVAVAAIFGVVNAILRPIIKTVGCAFYVFTLGLIALVVNGLLFLLTGWIADQLGLPFKVEGVLSAILGALIVGVISWAINLAIPDKD